MLLKRLISKHNKSNLVGLYKYLNVHDCKYSNQSNSDNNSDKNNKDSKLGGIGLKYKTFKDEDAELILDIYEEKLKYDQEQLLEQEGQENLYKGINLEHGVTGVYDIEDLVVLLRRENAINIFVAKVPQEIQYVDYIVVVSGKSKRHMKAVIEFVRKVYKQKRFKNDLIPRIEGEDSNQWMALDLGNIALHVFSNEAREYYDLDSLWSVGPEYDKEFNKKDELVEMLEKHTLYLHDLEPAS